MAWTSSNQIMTAQSVAGTEILSDAVTLTPGEICNVQVKAVFPNPATDNLYLRLYTSLDNSQWDTEEFRFLGSIAKGDGATKYMTFQVFGVRYFKVGAIRSGSTDTITTDMWEIQDGIDAS